MCLVGTAAALLVPAGALSQLAVPQQCAVVNHFVLDVGRLRDMGSGIRREVLSMGLGVEHLGGDWAEDRCLGKELLPGADKKDSENCVKSRSH